MVTLKSKDLVVCLHLIVLVFCRYVESKWKHIKVGNILYLERDDFIPVKYVVRHK